MEATIHNLFKDPAIMPNNLDAVIRASNMTKKQVAKAAGMTPETLSRHIHGHVQMTLENAERYAEILDVSVQKIMFVNPPLPIIAHAHIAKNGNITRNYFEKWTEGLQVPGFIGDDLCVVKWSADEEYKGEWYEYRQALAFFYIDPIQQKTVHPGCIENVSIIKLKEEVKLPGNNAQNILGGILYPEPGRRYTIYSPKQGLHLTKLEIEWATPYRSMIFRPDLAGVTVVDLETS